jgi:flagellar M-ring protein FliF
MEALFAQLRALSTRHQILLAGGVTSVILLLLAGLWFFVLQPNYSVLFTQLRATDAATIVAELDRTKVPYRLSDGGATILVPADLVDRTRLNVMTEDLPLKGTVGFELFDKSDMGLTDFAQKINYQRALQGELERTIDSLDGVDSARVHLSLGEDRIFQDDRVPPKASIEVRMREGHVLSGPAARGIQKLVAASVPNLEPANVVVLDAFGQVVNTAGEPSKPSAEAASAPDEERSAVEHYYEARVRRSLERAYPLNTITVQVRADVPVGTDDTLAGWSPAVRTFALHVTLSPVLALDQAAIDNIQTLLAGAIGFDAAKNDSMNVVPVTTADDYRPPARRAKLPDATETLNMPDGAVSQTSPFVIAAVVVLAALAGLLLLRRRSPRRLSDDERQAFAARLQAAMSGEGGDAL